jgi:mono/diheme cytochrome c family protein
VFKVQNFLILEFRKKEEEKTKAAAPAPAAEVAPAPKSISVEPKPNAKEVATALAAETPVVAAVSDGTDPLANEALYKKKCAACHSLAANSGKLRSKHMKSPDAALKLAQWMQKLSKQDRSKNISDEEAQKIAAFIMAPGAKLY